jgi:hypothetical protein
VANPGNGAKPRAITETGAFSPGVGIDREDNRAALTWLVGTGKPSCTVSYVHFTDGASWTTLVRSNKTDRILRGQAIRPLLSASEQSVITAA